MTIFQKGGIHQPVLLGLDLNLCEVLPWYSCQPLRKHIARNPGRYIYILRSCSTLDIQTPGEDRCFNPQTSSEKAFRGSKHLLTRYLEDFGCLGVDKEHRQYPQVSTKRILFPLEELNGLISTLTCILRAGTRFVSENPLLAFPKLLTPLACNMEPKNNPIEKENHLSILRFLSSTLIFQGVPFA